MLRFCYLNMQVEDLIFEDNSFGKLVQEWANSYNVATKPLESKSTSAIDMGYIDGLVLFHENHDISKFHDEVMELFKTHQVGISKIDINGTLSVASSNFDLWMDRNRAKHVLVIGDERLAKNANAQRFLETIKLR